MRVFLLRMCDSGLIADILQVLNLSELGNSLNQHANALLALIDCDLSKERARLEDLAETPLFIDGSLA